MTWRRPGLLAAAALLVAALGCFVASFLVAPSRGALALAGRSPSVSAAPGHEAAVPLQRWLGGEPGDGSMTVAFSFADRRPAPGQVIVRSGNPDSGLQVRVDGLTGGGWYVGLRLTPWPQGPLRAVLVHRLVPGRRYDVRVTLRDGRALSAWVSGRPAFSYTAPTATVGTLFNPLVAGDRAGAASVGDLTLAYRAYRTQGSSGAAIGLRTAAAMAAMAFAGLLAAALVSSGATSTAPAVRRRLRGARAALAARRGLAGLALLVAGGALVQLVTPPADAVVTRSGHERLALAGVPTGHEASYALGGGPARGGSAASVDTTLSFELRIERRARVGGTRVISTALGATGIVVSVNPDRSLVASIKTSAVQRGAFLLVRRVPFRRPVPVEIQVVRSREVQAFVDGTQAYAYTYASPVWQAAPTGLEIGTSGSGIAVRRVTSTTTLFTTPSSGSSLLLVRLAQAVGFLLVAAGAALVASRLLGRLFPAARPSRPLVRAVFGVAAAGIAINLLVDALRLQRSPAPFVPRNSWLFASDARFSDFLQVFELLRGLHPYGEQAGSYPPVGYFLVGPFVPMGQFAALLAFLGLFAGVFGWWLWRSFAAGRRLEAALVVVVALASYPVTFAVDRANVDLLVALLLLVAVAAVEQRREWLGASLIGLSAAAKIFPGLYALLFIRPLRRWRYGLVAAAVALVATLLCFLGLDGSLAANIAGLRRGLGVVEAFYGNGVQSTVASVTVSSWLQAIGYAVGGVAGAQAVEAVCRHGLLVEELAGAAAVAWYLWRREREPWRAVTLVTVAVLVLPQVSYAYELLYLFIPLALFVRDAPPGPRSLRLAALFGLLLAPKAYLYFGDSFIDSGTLFNAPLLVALGVGVVYDGWAERRAGRAAVPEGAVALRLASAPPADAEGGPRAARSS